MSRTWHHGDKVKLRRFGDAWRWVWREPKFWRKTMKHAKRRTELKRALASRDHDGAVYPLDKKPWLYYW